MYLHGINNAYAVTVMDVETAVTAVAVDVAEIVLDVRADANVTAVDVVAEIVPDVETAVTAVAVDVVAVVAEMVMDADARMLKYQMTILQRSHVQLPHLHQHLHLHLHLHQLRHRNKMSRP
jgi:hypothetical protein